MAVTRLDASATEQIDGRSIRAATIGAVSGVTFVLLAFVAIESWQANVGSALALSGALFVVGYLVGLLFAVPKSVAVAQPVASATTRDEIASSSMQSPISINTNFEQISDWLTKIIVGVGLVQAGAIYRGGAVVAVRIGAAVGCPAYCNGAHIAGGEILGASILLGFPTLGLIVGFLSVRLYIARAIYAADTDVLRPPQSKFAARDVEEVASLPSTTPRRSSTSESADTVIASPAVNEILSTPFAALVSIEDKITWGKASLASRNYLAAVDALGAAMSEVHDRPDVAVAYVDALYGASASPDYSKIIAVLEGARRQLSSQTAMYTRRRVMEELINAYLYSEPPGGFQTAIRLLDEYLAGDGKEQASAYVYSAAAHGQKYEWLMRLDDPSAQSELPIIVAMVIKAIEFGGASSKRWLQALATSSSIDNDLVQATKDNEELRTALSL